MKKKLLTLKELRKSWWWNRKEIRRDGVKGVDWSVVEEAARNYELMRRSPKGKKFKKTYLELFPDEKTVVHVLWVNWTRGAYRPATNPSQFNEIGWTPVTSQYQHRQWNLRLSDKELTDEFIREVRILRKMQKIRAPHPLKGKKFRGVSWKLVEILDRKLNGIGRFTDSQRHTLSIARRRAKKYLTAYNRALDKRQNNPNPAFNIGETDDSDTTD